MRMKVLLATTIVVGGGLAYYFYYSSFVPCAKQPLSDFFGIPSHVASCERPLAPSAISHRY
jgi:hypothetical protein